MLSRRIIKCNQQFGLVKIGQFYLINNKEDLLFLSNHPQEYWVDNNKFKQTDDIDMQNAQYNPIGNSQHQFNGQYYGCGYTIKNLYTNNSSSHYQGMFGYTNGAFIKDVGVIDSHFTGRQCVGAVIGRADDTTITSCFAYNCMLYGTSYVGGLLGMNGYWSQTVYSHVINCNSTASDSTSRVGGFCGFNAHDSFIQDSYNDNSSADGNINVGGFVGLHSDRAIIDRCYSTGHVQGSSYVGGLIGRLGVDAETFNSYWCVDTSGQSSSADGIPIQTLEQMKDKTLYSEWNFTNGAQFYQIIHFTENQEWVPPVGVRFIDILVVGGGGSGAHTGSDTGGGGGGGLIYRNNLRVDVNKLYNIKIGEGCYVNQQQIEDINSSQFDHLIALGGGPSDDDPQTDGNHGGSGSGAGRNSGVGGDGIQPTMQGQSGIYGYGNRGGTNTGHSGTQGMGGGGAGQHGADAIGIAAQDKSGGDGLNFYYQFGNLGDEGWFAGGGGGGGQIGDPSQNLGGKGGGGRGGHISSQVLRTGQPGMQNTGGGGGGGDNSTGGVGGSGVIVIRYRIQDIISDNVWQIKQGLTLPYITIPKSNYLI